MGLRGITLNTPPEEEAHIIAEDDAAIYQSIFGEDGVFTIGDRMKATVINNNQVRVSNGVICVGGHIARTVYGDYSDMTIENGEISKNRNDIITAVFSTTGEKGIDKFKIEVKKGTSGVVAEDPELTKENLYEGGKLRELPLWRVKLEGINIIGVEQMFKIIHKIPDLEEMIESLNGKLNMEKIIIVRNNKKSVFRHPQAYGFTSVTCPDLFFDNSEGLFSHSNGVIVCNQDAIIHAHAHFGVTSIAHYYTITINNSYGNSEIFYSYATSIGGYSGQTSNYFKVKKGDVISLSFGLNNGFSIAAKDLYAELDVRLVCVL